MSKEQFISDYGGVANYVGEQIGVDPSILLSQWGLETGWGKSVIPGTNNLGNIKDFRRNSDGVTATDNMNGSVDKYRKFDTPEAFGDHFIGLLQRKYPNAIGAGSDAQKFASALKAGGYAEDPGYVGKIVATNNGMRTPGLLERIANAVIPTAAANEIDILGGSQIQGDYGQDPFEKFRAGLSTAPASGQIDILGAADAPGEDPFAAFRGGIAQNKGLDAKPPASASIIPAAHASDGTQPEQPERPGFLSNIGRQLGLTANAAIKGVGNAVGIIGDPLNVSVNALLGTSLPPVSQSVNRLADAITPAPANATERAVNDVASGIANPINFIPGMAAASQGRNLLSTVGRSAALGAAQAGMMPVEPGTTLGQYGNRLLGGAAAGGALGGAAYGIGKAGNALLNAGESAGNKLSALINGPRQLPEDLLNRAEIQIQAQLGKAGVDLSSIPQGILSNLKTQVATALDNGQTLDAAALLRKADFQSLGMRGTLGQITRDPMQWAQEKNLRGVQGAGEPLAEIFNGQNIALGNRLTDIAPGAANPYQAGNALTARLQGLDAPVRERVGAAYQSARDEAGRYANINTKQFSETANAALDEQMLGRFLPSNIRGMLNDVSAGKIPLNVNNAVQFDSTLSEAQRTLARQGDSAGQRAIGVIRDALHGADIESAAGQTAKQSFDAARGMARERFATIDRIPALKAALDDVDPDKYVQKYIINGKTNDLSALANYVRADPEAQKIVRSQIIDHLQSKAFGMNVTGDKSFAPESFNKALQSIGTDKLSTFFSPEEISTLQAIGRVGANINTVPAGSAPNFSNTASAAMNLFSAMKEGGIELPFVKSFKVFGDAIRNRGAVDRAINPNLTPTAVPRNRPNMLLPAVAPSAAGMSRQDQ